MTTNMADIVPDTLGRLKKKQFAIFVLKHILFPK
jgi:hypothetical protein